MEMNKCGIYGLIDKENDYIYLGQSADIARRWSNHGAYLKKNEHRYKDIQDAYNRGVLGWTILEECSEDENELAEREDWWFKNADKMGYIVVNKQKFGKKEHRVKDTSNMKAAQTGSKNPNNTKLCVEDVIEIKKMLGDGVKQNVIASKFGVSSTLIHNIFVGKRWASVEVVK